MARAEPGRSARLCLGTTVGLVAASVSCSGAVFVVTMHDFTNVALSGPASSNDSPGRAGP